jgi:hypothetical protein
MARREGAWSRGDFASSGHDRRLTPVVAVVAVSDGGGG